MLNQPGPPKGVQGAPSVEREHASLNPQLVLSLASAYRDLFGGLVSSNLSGLIDMLRQFEELDWIRDSTSKEHGD